MSKKGKKTKFEIFISGMAWVLGLYIAATLVFFYFSWRAKEREKMKDPLYAKVVREMEENSRVGWVVGIFMNGLGIYYIATLLGAFEKFRPRTKADEEWDNFLRLYRKESAIKKVCGKEYVRKLKEKYGDAWADGYDKERENFNRMVEDFYREFGGGEQSHEQLIRLQKDKRKNF